MSCYELSYFYKILLIEFMSISYALTYAQANNRSEWIIRVVKKKKNFKNMHCETLRVFVN